MCLGFPFRTRKTIVEVNGVLLLEKKLKLSVSPLVPSPLVPASALALAELESCASALLTVLLALLHARVAGQQAFGLEHLAQFRVELNQRACNAELDRIGLRSHAAALHRGDHVEARGQFHQRQSALCRYTLLLGHKVGVR